MNKRRIRYLGCVLLIPVGVLLAEGSDATREETATVLGKTHDNVKIAKRTTTNRFQVAVKHDDGTSETVDVPFHVFYQAEKGKKITYTVSAVSDRMQMLTTVAGSLCVLVGGVAALLLTFGRKRD